MLARLFFDVASWYTVGIEHNLAAAHFGLAGSAILFNETCFLQQNGVSQPLMSLLVSNIDGNVAADLIQQLAITQVLGKLHHVPSASKYDISPIVPGFLDRGRNDFLDELIHTVCPVHNRSYSLDSIAQRIVGVAVAAAGHDESLACVVYYLGLAFLNEGLGSSLVAYIDVLAVFHGKGFYYLVAFSGENLAIDHEVGTIIALAAGKHTHASDNTHHCDAR